MYRPALFSVFSLIADSVFACATLIHLQRIPPASFDDMLGQLMLVFATVVLLHAAYSTYEHLSHLKALGRPEGALPTDIVLEAFAALILATVGATLRASPLREVTWRSEMKRRASEEEQDPRLSFATFIQRAGIASSSK
ncbi:hypothetical protein A0H81_05875 [Grifola frondosa]|uniref:Uncharacterized protein n=1 Tax=Grifola frondosa TaxID=5627 RepID=A0A1C7MAW6_GRIFR|nr:hypothetical protein A0H81_05875 [Grifola frondosa]